ncbi:uncharacterized protein LOC114313150 [Camellia sinensis]|uniref:uncharacterized protein LOC114313150 n=1 Tax=Camellia sinensis TaxID=4442 RepID=UPI0010355D54|nr:uncharacterized protein LOC114313150 [Camellia sinensis]
MVKDFPDVFPNELLEQLVDREIEFTIDVIPVSTLALVMVPYEALYGGNCRSLVCWTEDGDRAIYGTKLVQQTTKKIKIVQQRLKTVQSRQKSCVDQRKRDLEYEIGDHVFIKVTPMKGQTRFDKKGKSTPRYIGQFQIVETLGPIAYQIALPLGMEQIDNVFHVSMLRGYLRDPFHVINYHLIALDGDMTYEEWSVQIINRQVKQLRNRSILMVTVEWREHYRKEATWEKEDEM